MSTPKVTEKTIRTFLQDKPETNTLLAGVRWSPEEIDDAIITVIDDYNTMLPPTNPYTVETFPYRSLLLKGVSGWLLKGAAVNQASNNLTYDADGIQVNDNDKAAVFSDLGKQFYDEFKEQAQQIKIAQNVSGAFGHTGSEFGYRQGRW